MFKWIRNLFWKFIYGDIWWARMRLVFIFVLVDFIAMIIASTFEVTSPMGMWHYLVLPTIVLIIVFRFFMLIVHDVKEVDKANTKIVKRVLLLALFFLITFWAERKLVGRIGLTGPFIGNYLIAPLAVVIITMFAAARYVQDIYSLESYSLAFVYVAASFWGVVYPKVTVDDSQYKVEPGKLNRLEQIGGPGYLTIRPGNAVILNDMGTNSRVCSSTKVFLSHFGSVISIVDLNNQRGTVAVVTAMTKDGIIITIRDIQIRYRIWFSSEEGNENKGRIQSNPYPYDDQAVRDSVYRLVVPDKGLKPLTQEVVDKGVKRWSQMVEGIVVSQITSYITERKFDEIVTPTFQKHEPRDEIRNQLLSPDTEKKLKGIGAKLLWCDIGHFEADKAVIDQRLENWSAKWIGNANVVRARGEAQRSAYQELGRAEAHADILMSIIHAFDDIDLSVEQKNENIRKVVLMRSAQVLEALTNTKAQDSQKKRTLLDSTGEHKDKENS